LLLRSPNSKSIHLCLQTSSGGSSGGISSRFPLPSSFRTILGSYAGLSEQLQFAALAVLAQYAAEDAQLQQLAGSFAAYEEWSARVLVSAAGLLAFVIAGSHHCRVFWHRPLSLTVCALCCLLAVAAFKH
jgi:hypothetical protein